MLVYLFGNSFQGPHTIQMKGKHGLGRNVSIAYNFEEVGNGHKVIVVFGIKIF